MRRIVSKFIFLLDFFREFDNFGGSGGGGNGGYNQRRGGGGGGYRGGM